MAVGLPLVWNYVVKEKWEAYRKSQEDKIDIPTLEAERIAIELIVNERRAEKGLPPYPYHSYYYTTMNQQDGTSSLTNTNTSSQIPNDISFMHSSASHEALWKHVEQLHKNNNSTNTPPSSLSNSTKATVPVHASDDYIKASQAYFASKGKLGAIKSMNNNDSLAVESCSSCDNTKQ